MCFACIIQVLYTVTTRCIYDICWGVGDQLKTRPVLSDFLSFLCMYMHVKCHSYHKQLRTYCSFRNQEIWFIFCTEMHIHTRASASRAMYIIGVVQSRLCILELAFLHFHTIAPHRRCLELCKPRLTCICMGFNIAA